jgi:hypothetical protein
MVPDPMRSAPVVRSTFTKGTVSLVVECYGNAELVVLFQHTKPQVFRFEDAAALVFFQSDLEQQLVEAGWTLTTFEATGSSA